VIFVTRKCDQDHRRALLFSDCRYFFAARQDTVHVFSGGAIVKQQSSRLNDSVAEQSLLPLTVSHLKSANTLKLAIVLKPGPPHVNAIKRQDL